MSESPQPDYVDRCIDYISTHRTRWIADITLGTIILGAVSIGLAEELDVNIEQRASATAMQQVAATKEPCKFRIGDASLQAAEATVGLPARSDTHTSETASITPSRTYLSPAGS